MDDRQILFLMDGRPMNQPLTGAFDMNHFPTEYIERIEAVGAVRGFLYGLNGTGDAINLVTRSYSTNKPISRLRHIEGPYEFIYTDGLFSQNVARNMNLQVALTRQFLAGRYPNSAFDAWSLRAKFRYDLSTKINISISELFNKTKVGLNGGVDIRGNPSEETIFNSYLAPLRSTDGSDEIVRHDLNLIVGARLFDDSTAISTATVYYSHLSRMYQESSIGSEEQTQWFGLTIRQNYDTRFQSLDMGAEVERAQLLSSPNAGSQTQSRLGLYLKDELRVLPRLNLALFSRYDHIKSDLLSFGADARFALGESLYVFGGLSFSYRIPSFTESYWSDTSIVPLRSSQIQNEKHRYLEVGLKYDESDVFSIRYAYFRREVMDAISASRIAVSSSSPPTYWPITFLNVGKRIYSGFESLFKLRIWRMHAEGSCTYLLGGDSDSETLRFPKIFITGRLYFRDKFFDGNLDLELGLKGKYVSEQYGQEYYPQLGIYSDQTTYKFGPSRPVDFFVIAKIGGVYIHLVWENLIDEKYFLTPVYPMADRGVTFGVSWTFLD
jgi:iron complex outermembrane receptor protein